MSRFIDADVARRVINSERSKEQMLRVFDSIPTADVRENVRGKWIQKCGLKRMCNRCGEDVEYFSCDKDYKFCPYCGADMRKKVRGEWQREPLPELRRVTEMRGEEE